MRWKDIVGYAGVYQISDTGLVRTAYKLGRGRPKLPKGQWRVVSGGRKHGYSYINLYDANGKPKCFYIHRLLITAFVGIIPKNMEIHHKNSDRSDNRFSNLQVVLHSQNMKCVLKRKTPSSSQYKGVHFDKRNKRWCTQICLNNKSTHLGSYEFEIDAAYAYNEAAIKHYGEFARINAIDS